MRTTVPAQLPNNLIHNFEGSLNIIFGFFFFETRFHSVAQADLDLTVVAQTGPRLLSAISLGILSQLHVSTLQMTFSFISGLASLYF